MLLKEHGRAINADLLKQGWRRRDIGRRLSWGDFRDFVEWLPPTGESALWRSRKPRSWWVTPEVQFLNAAIHVLELANWQRSGGKKAGPAPKVNKLPEDQDVSVKSATDLADKRRANADHLKRRRAELKKRAEVSSIGRKGN